MGLTALLLLGGCGRPGEDPAHREWRVAGDKHASPGDIIDAGHPVDIATNGGQTVVTWEVAPEDDDGPYQGAWRLYGEDGEPVADGRFKQVFEASAGIAVHPYRDGFVLVDYANRQPYLLDRRGHVRRPAKGTNTATLLGTYVQDENYTDLSEAWIQLPHLKRLVRWPDLPTGSPQGMVVAGGELWVGMPRAHDDETGRIAHSKTGRKPWVIESMANPRGSAIDSESLTSSRGNIFAVAIRMGAGRNGDRIEVASVQRRRLGRGGTWQPITADGLSSGSVAEMTIAPKVTQMPDGHLLASGEGAWLLAPSGKRWSAVPLGAWSRTSRGTPLVRADGTRLWALSAHDLFHSDDLGRKWVKFER